MQKANHSRNNKKSHTKSFVPKPKKANPLKLFRVVCVIWFQDPWFGGIVKIINGLISTCEHLNQVVC